MEGKKRKKRKRKGKIEDKTNTTTTRESFRLKSLAPRSVVDTRLWNSRNQRKLSLALSLLETPPDKIKALRVAEGSRAKYEAGRVYLCDSVVITRPLRPAVVLESKRTLSRYFRFGNRIRVKSSSERKNLTGFS